MAVDNKQVEEFEKKYKDTIFAKIIEVGSTQFEGISKMTTNATNLGQSHVSIPNVSTTLNNKIVELSHEFRNAGISMFSKEFEDYGFVGSSFLGDAIIHDLIDKLATSTDKLGEYGKTIGNVAKQKNERVLALQNVSPIRKFFSRIRAFFVPVQPVDLSLTEEEQGMLDSSLQEYKDIDSDIWKYNLEDNIVQALVKEIAGSQKFGDFDIPHKHHAFNVPGLLEESVIPDLKRLGLEHLVPQLQEALIEEYKKDLPDSEIYQVKDEDMHLYVPDFTRKSERKEEVDLEELSRQAKSVIADSKKTIKETKKSLIQQGISLSDFSLVDRTSNASARQSATSAIGEELHPVQEVNQDKVQESTDISLDD